MGTAQSGSMLGDMKTMRLTFILQLGSNLETNTILDSQAGWWEMHCSFDDKYTSA